jgi:hypothetical protein
VPPRWTREDVIPLSSVQSLCGFYGTALQEAPCLLLEKGADIKVKNNKGKTALHCPAANGYEAVVRLLLEKGVDIEAKYNNNGRTALHFAAMYWQDIQARGSGAAAVGEGGKHRGEGQHWTDGAALGGYKGA